MGRMQNKLPPKALIKKYCGTAQPDVFLRAAAQRFLSEVLDPLQNLSGRNPFVIKTKGKKVSAGAAKDGSGELWINIFSEYAGDECIVFPFSTPATPRGVVTYNFKRMDAHRAMCLKVNKLPPAPGMWALHRCGNGHLGCVTPKHLYWGTRSENAADARGHVIDGKPECVPAHF